MAHGDCILFGNVRTLDPAHPTAEALAIRRELAMTIVGGEVAYSAF